MSGNKNSVVKTRKIRRLVEAEAKARVAAIEAKNMAERAKLVEDFTKMSVSTTAETLNSYVQTGKVVQNYNGNRQKKTIKKKKGGLVSTIIGTVTILGLFHLATATNCNYERIDEIAKSDCFMGKFDNFTFSGYVWCQCKCTRNWAYMTNGCPSKPRYHILACKFGGPKHGYNCFNDNELEPWWTEQEQKVKTLVSSGHNVSVYLDPYKGKFCINGVCDFKNKLTVSSGLAGAAVTGGNIKNTLDKVEVTTRSSNIKVNKEHRVVDDPRILEPQNDLHKFSSCDDINDIVYIWNILGYGFECTKGLPEEIKHDSDSCIKNTYVNGSVCIHRPSENCEAASIGIYTTNVMEIHRKTLGNEVMFCCNMPCFSKDDLFYWLTYQPMCTACFEKFVKYLWDEDCYNQISKNVVKIDNFIIFKDFAIVEFGGYKLKCTNNHDFSKCCNGNGPSVKYDSYDYVDKLCACNRKQEGLTVGVKHTVVHLIKTLAHNFANFLLMFFVPLLVMVVNKRMGILLGLMLGVLSLGIGVFAGCSVDNTLPLSLDHDGNNDGWTTTSISMSVGQCFYIGNSQYELVKITQNAQYKFLGFIPYKVKVVCTDFDWSCYGSGRNLASIKTTCEQKCDQNIIVQKFGTQSDFSGSGCAISISPVDYKVDICYSIGRNTSWAKYFELSNVVEDVKLHFMVTKIKKTRSLDISNNEIYTDSDIVMRNINIYNRPSAEIVVVREGVFHCSNYRLHLENVCMFDELSNIKSFGMNCIKTDYRWLPSAVTWKTTMTTSEFESFVDNYFVNCDEQFDFDKNGNILVLQKQLYHVTFDISSKKHCDIEGLERCDTDKMKFELTSPGATGYHKKTLMRVRSKIENCTIAVYMDNCTNVSPPTDIIKKESRFEFYCNFWANGMGTIIGKKIVRQDFGNVVENWMPHKLSIRYWTNLAIKTGNMSNVFGSLSRIVSSIQLPDYVEDLISFMHIGVKKMIVLVVILYIIYLNFSRGNLFFACVYGIVLYLLCFTDLVLSKMLIDNIEYSLASVFIDLICLVYMYVYFVWNNFSSIGFIKFVRLVDFLIKIVIHVSVFYVVGYYGIFFLWLINLIFYIVSWEIKLENLRKKEILYINPLTYFIFSMIKIEELDVKPHSHFELYSISSVLTLKFKYLVFIKKILSELPVFSLVIYIIMLNIHKVLANDDTDVCWSDKLEIMWLLTCDYVNRLINVYNETEHDIFEYQLNHMRKFWKLSNGKIVNDKKTAIIKHVNDASLMDIKEPWKDLDRMQKYNLKDLKENLMVYNVEEKRDIELLPKTLYYNGHECIAIVTDVKFTCYTPVYVNKYFISLINGYFEVSNRFVYPLWNVTYETNVFNYIINETTKFVPTSDDFNPKLYKKDPGSEYVQHINSTAPTHEWEDYHDRQYLSGNRYWTVGEKQYETKAYTLNGKTVHAFKTRDNILSGTAVYGFLNKKRYSNICGYYEKDNEKIYPLWNMTPRENVEIGPTHNNLTWHYTSTDIKNYEDFCDVFSNDTNRSKKFIRKTCNVHLDFWKNMAVLKTLNATFKKGDRELVSRAKKIAKRQWRTCKMFEQKFINATNIEEKWANYVMLKLNCMWFHENLEHKRTWSDGGFSKKDLEICEKLYPNDTRLNCLLTKLRFPRNWKNLVHKKFIYGSGDNYLRNIFLNKKKLERVHFEKGKVIKTKIMNKSTRVVIRDKSKFKSFDKLPNFLREVMFNWTGLVETALKPKSKRDVKKRRIEDDYIKVRKQNRTDYITKKLEVKKSLYCKEKPKKKMIKNKDDMSYIAYKVFRHTSFKRCWRYKIVRIHFNKLVRDDLELTPNHCNKHGFNTNYFDIGADSPGKQLRLITTDKVYVKHNDTLIQFTRDKNNVSPIVGFSSYSVNKEFKRKKFRSGSHVYNNKMEFCGMYNISYKGHLLLEDRDMTNGVRICTEDECLALCNNSGVRFHSDNADLLGTKKADSEKVLRNRTVGYDTRSKSASHTTRKKERKVTKVDIISNKPSTSRASVKKQLVYMNIQTDSEDDPISDAVVHDSWESDQGKETETTDTEREHVTNDGKFTKKYDSPESAKTQELSKFDDIQDMIKYVTNTVFDFVKSHQCDDECLALYADNIAVGLIKSEMEQLITFKLTDSNSNLVIQNTIILSVLDDYKVYLKHFLYEFTKLGITQFKLNIGNNLYLEDFIDEDILKFVNINNGFKIYLSSNQWQQDKTSNFNFTDTLTNLNKYCIKKKKRIQQSLSKWKSLLSGISEEEKEHDCKFKWNLNKEIQEGDEVHREYLDNDRFYFKMIANLVSIGSASSIGKNLTTQYHVTKGNDIKEAMNCKEKDKSKLHIWKASKIDKVGDVCKYGEDCFLFEEVSDGEIVIAFNLAVKWTVAFIVNSTKLIKAQRDGTIFNSLIPIKLNFENDDFEYLDEVDFPGMSGSPIFNSNNKQIGVYGLSYFDENTMLEDHIRGNHTKDVVINYVSPNEKATKDIEKFFKKLCENLVTTELENPFKCFVVHAPTGVGKSTVFPVKLLMRNGYNKNDTKILICQPRRLGAINCYERIKSLLFKNKEDVNKYCIGLVLGTTAGSINENYGNGPLEITVMTHGRAIIDIINKNVKYDFILIDEYHDTYDVDLTALRIVLMNDDFMARHRNTKIICISATLEKADWMCTPNIETVNVTNFAINETTYKIDYSDIKTIEKKKGKIIIPANLISKIAGIGSAKQYILDVPDEFDPSEKLGVMIVPAIHSCEKIKDYLTKEYPELGDIKTMHSKNLDLITFSQKTSGIIVATDVIAQSVTLQNLYVVWDWLHHFKPSITYGDDFYKESLDLKLINISEKIQRMGRLGRTQPGYYVKLKGFDLNEAAKFEESTIVPAIFKIKLLKQQLLRKENLPTNWDNDFGLRVNEWKIEFDKCTDFYMDKYSNLVLNKTNSSVTVDESRLDSALNANIDNAALYVYFFRGSIPKEHYNRMLDHSWERFADRQSQSNWLAIMTRVFVVHDRYFYKDFTSFKESPEYHEDNVMDKILSKDSERTENYLWIIGGISMLAISAGISVNLLNEHTNRIVVKNVSISRYEVSNHAIKHLKQNNKEDVKYISTVSSFFQDIIIFIKNIFSKIWLKLASTFKINKSKEESLNSILHFIQLVKVKILALGGLISSSVGFVNLTASLGSLGFGALWYHIQRICGKGLGLVTISVINGLFGFFLSPMWASIAVGTQFFGFLMERLLNRNDNNYLTRDSFSGEAWIGLIGALGGAYIGNVLAAPIMAGGGLMLQVGAVATINNMQKYSGNPFIIFKNFYYIFGNMWQGDLDARNIWPLIVNGLTLIIQAKHCSIIQGITLAGIAFIALMLRMSIHQWVISFLGTVKFPALLELLQNDERYMEKVFDLVVCGVAVLADPSSIVSVLINGIINYYTDGDPNLKKCFTKAFYDYSGINAFYGICGGVGRLLNQLSVQLEGRTENLTTILGLFATLPVGIYYLFKLITKYRAADKKESIIHSFWSSLKYVCNRLLEIVINITNYICEKFGQIFEFIGEKIFKGMYNGIKNSLQSLCPAIFGKQQELITLENKLFNKLQVEIKNMQNNISFSDGSQILKLYSKDSIVDLFTIRCQNVSNRVTAITDVILNTKREQFKMLMKSFSEYSGHIDVPTELLCLDSEQLAVVLRTWHSNIRNMAGKVKFNIGSLTVEIECYSLVTKQIVIFDIVLQFDELGPYYLQLEIHDKDTGDNAIIRSNLPSIFFEKYYSVFIRRANLSLILPHNITKRNGFGSFLSRLSDTAVTVVDNITKSFEDKFDSFLSFADDYDRCYNMLLANCQQYFSCGEACGYRLLFCNTSVEIQENGVTYEENNIEGCQFDLPFKISVNSLLMREFEEIIDPTLKVDLSADYVYINIDDVNKCNLIGKLFKDQVIVFSKNLGYHAFKQLCYIMQVNCFVKMGFSWYRELIPRTCKCVMTYNGKELVYKNCGCENKISNIVSNIVNCINFKCLMLSNKQLEEMKYCMDHVHLIMCLKFIGSIDSLKKIEKVKKLLSMYGTIKVIVDKSPYSRLVLANYCNNSKFYEKSIILRSVEMLTSLKNKEIKKTLNSLKMVNLSALSSINNVVMEFPFCDISEKTIIHMELKDIKEKLQTSLDETIEPTMVIVHDNIKFSYKYKVNIDALSDDEICHSIFYMLETVNKNNNYAFLYALDFNNERVAKLVQSENWFRGNSLIGEQVLKKAFYHEIVQYSKEIEMAIMEQLNDNTEITSDRLNEIYDEAVKNIRTCKEKKNSHRNNNKKGEEKLENYSIFDKVKDYFNFNNDNGENAYENIAADLYKQLNVQKENVIKLKENLKPSILKFVNNLNDYVMSQKELSVKPIINVEKEIETFDDIMKAYDQQKDEDVWFDAEDIMSNVQFSDTESFNFVKGFNHAIIGKPKNWYYLTLNKIPYLEEINEMVPTIEEFIRSNIKVNELAKRVWTKKDWEKYRYYNRVKLPKKAETSGVASSRAFYKCQQLIEADAPFFTECETILDPCCGSGGFAEAFGHLYIARKPAEYRFCTLIAPKHRQPDLARMQVKNSNLKLVKLEGYKNNNIRQKEMIKVLVDQNKNVDLLIFDIGENSPDSATNDKFWLNKTEELTTMVEAVCELQNCLKQGGKMLLKMSGPSKYSKLILEKTTSKFKRIKILKLGTTPDLSNEYYVYCLAYNRNVNIDINTTQRAELVDNITRLYSFRSNGKYISYLGKILRDKNYFNISKFLKEPIIRTDWWTHENKGHIYSISSQGNLPGGVKLDFINCNNEHVYIDWSEPNWDKRIKTFIDFSKELDPRVKFGPANVSKFEYLSPLMTLKRKAQIGSERKLVNSFIYRAVNEVFGMDRTSATYCQVQSTPEWREASFKKRLDCLPKQPSPDSIEAISRALTLMDTNWAKQHLGKCRFLKKEEVEKLVNYQGATSVLEPASNLKDLMEKYPNWYDICMKLIEKLEQGQYTGRHYMARAKMEAKQKKNVEEGKLIHKPGVLLETLEEYNVTGHRYIQFSNGFARLVDYIMFGQLLELHNKQKLYKGSFNGVPPYVLGAAMKTVFDLTEKPEKRTTFITKDKFYDSYNNYHINNHLSLIDSKFWKYKDLDSNLINDEILNSLVVREKQFAYLHDDSGAAAISLDFSSWDGSVNIQERALLARDYCRFYPEKYHKAIVNNLEEQCFGILLDDDMDIFVRGGQRGSGEWDTSFGNTKLVAANIFVALSEVLGITLEEMLNPVAVLNQCVGKSGDDHIIKTLEIPAVPVVADGDDVVILCTKRQSRIIKETIEEPLTRAGKVIRSGNVVGATLCNNFGEINFCSHRYEPALIGPDAQDLKLDAKEYLVVTRKQLEYKMYYLPTKHVSDVLSKIIFTLKQSTINLNLNILDDDRIKEMLTKLKQFTISDYYETNFEENETETIDQEKYSLKYLKHQLEGMDITRAKIQSYIYLYPHDKIVRWFCLGLLSIIGDDEVSNYDLIRKYGIENMPKRSKLLGGLKAIYNVSSLNDITFRDSWKNYNDYKNLIYNVSLTKKNAPRTIHSICDRLFQFMDKMKIRDSKIFSIDKRFAIKFLKYHVKFKGNVPYFDDDKTVIINSNKLLEALARSFCNYVSDSVIPKVVIYAPPGSGKTTLKPKLIKIMKFFNEKFNIDYDQVVDTDETKITNNSVVITNLYQMISDIYPTIYFDYEKTIWDNLVKTKCIYWKENWYASSQSTKNKSLNIIKASNYIGNYEYEIYKSLAKIFEIGKRQNKYHYKDFLKYELK